MKKCLLGILFLFAGVSHADIVGPDNTWVRAMHPHERFQSELFSHGYRGTNGEIELVCSGENCWIQVHGQCSKKGPIVGFLDLDKWDLYKYGYWTESANKWVTLYELCSYRSAQNCDLQLDTDGCFRGFKSRKSVQ